MLAVGGAIAMDTTNGGDSVERQVQVKFVTKLPPALRVVSSAFAIPAKLGRYGLSEVVNTLLGHGNFSCQGFLFVADLESWCRGCLNALLLVFGCLKTLSLRVWDLYWLLIWRFGALVFPLGC